VGRLRTRLLRNEPLRLADDEHLPRAHRGTRGHEPAECLNLGEEDAGRLAGGGGTQRLRAPRLDLRGARILEGILQPVCAGTPGAHERKEPVQVGMLEPQYHPTGLTLATGAVRVRLQAEQELTEPEGQPLL